MSHQRNRRQLHLQTWRCLRHAVPYAGENSLPAVRFEMSRQPLSYFTRSTAHFLRFPLEISFFSDRGALFLLAQVGRIDCCRAGLSKNNGDALQQIHSYFHNALTYTLVYTFGRKRANKKMTKRKNERDSLIKSYPLQTNKGITRRGNSSLLDFPFSTPPLLTTKKKRRKIRKH